jgi:hypothetical protein
MLPAERPFAWLGGVRPSDAAAVMLAQPAAGWPPPQRAALEALRVRALGSGPNGCKPARPLSLLMARTSGGIQPDSAWL